MSAHARYYHERTASEKPVAHPKPWLNQTSKSSIIISVQMVFYSLLYESLIVNSQKLMGWVSYKDAGVFGIFDDHKLVRDVAPQLLEAFGVV